MLTESRPLITVKSETRSGITILRLSGDLDSRSAIQDVPGVPDMTENGMRLVLDLADVPFVNSGGVSELVQLVAAANTRGGRVVLANLSPFFERVLQTTQLDRFFTVGANLDEAILECSR